MNSAKYPPAPCKDPERCQGQQRKQPQFLAGAGQGGGGNRVGGAGEGQTVGALEIPICLSAKDSRSQSEGCGEVKYFAQMSDTLGRGF